MCVCVSCLCLTKLSLAQLPAKLTGGPDTHDKSHSVTAAILNGLAHFDLINNYIGTRILLRSKCVCRRTITVAPTQPN